MNYIYYFLTDVILRILIISDSIYMLRCIIIFYSGQYLVIGYSTSYNCVGTGDDY